MKLPSLTPEQRRTRARIARNRQNDPAAADELARDFRAERAEQYIRELVDAWPPLTAEQRADLAALLAPGLVASPSTSDGQAVTV